MSSIKINMYVCFVIDHFVFSEDFTCTCNLSFVNIKKSSRLLVKSLLQWINFAYDQNFDFFTADFMEKSSESILHMKFL